MTLPIVIPASNSPASDDSRTPLSPTEPPQTNNTAANNKRKPSRRANTAERRATHNAVERQRRETLNGRFLDLAALLPNLSQIRRPSKSSIVNSSIAHIHASRRHRLLAARELRALKVEADALRRELNEWRDRSGIPRVEEPVRGEGFSMVLSGELEVLVVPGMVTGVGIDEEDEDYPGASEDAYPIESQDVDDPRLAMIKNANLVPSNGSSSPPSNASSSPPYPHRPSISVPQQPVLAGPMIASPTAMSYDNPVMAGIYSPADSHIPQHTHVMYHSQGPYPMHPHQMGPHPMMDAEKVAQWNMMQQQQAHKMNADQMYLASLARRGRSASISTGSRSSGSVSPVQTYDVPQFESGFEPGFDGPWSHGGGVGGKQQPVFAMMM